VFEALSLVGTASALKVVHAGGPLKVIDVLREVEMSSSVKNDNIVKAQGVHVTSLFDVLLEMELYDGGDIDSLTRPDKNSKFSDFVISCHNKNSLLPEKIIWSFADQLFQIASDIERAELVHCDVKLSNSIRTSLECLNFASLLPPRVDPAAPWRLRRRNSRRQAHARILPSRHPLLRLLPVSVA
jgi:serine/threonine protein kinase